MDSIEHPGLQSVTLRILLPRGDLRIYSVECVDSGHVPENSAGRRLLTRCFKAPELEYLNRHAEFQKAVARMATLTDFENVAALGQHLLDSRDEPARASERLSGGENTARLRA